MQTILYNILTDTEPPRARPGPSRPSSSSGGPPAAARCGGVTNPTTEHRDAVGRSEAQVGECIAHPGLSPGPINRRLRRRAQELVFTRSKCGRKRVKMYTNVGWRRDGIFLEKKFCSELTLGLGRLAPRAHKAGAPRSSRAPAHYYPALSIASPTPAGRPPPRAGPASSGSVGSLGRGSH